MALVLTKYIDRSLDKNAFICWRVKNNLSINTFKHALIAHMYTMFMIGAQRILSEIRVKATPATITVR